MIERIALAALLLSTAGATVAAMRRHSPLHLFVLLVGAVSLVGCFYPLVTLLVEPSTWRNVAFLPHDAVADVQAEYLALALGLAAACAAFSASGRSRPVAVERGARVRPLARHRDRVVCWSLLLVGAVLYSVYVRRVGLGALLNRDDYAEKYLLSEGLGLWAAGLKLMILACLWAEAGSLPARTKRLFRAAAIAIGAWSIAFLSVRSNFVVLLAGYAYLWCRRSGFQLRRVRPALVVLLLAAYFGLESFALFRGAYRGDASAAVRLLAQNAESSLARAVGGSELGHPFITAMEVTSAREPGELGGSSYLAALPNLIPTALWPDRPPTLSQQFAWSHYQGLAVLGGGTAYSLVAEAWLNFGRWIGSFAVGLACGWLLLSVERRAATHPDGFVARLAPSLPYLVVIANRSEAATLVKQAFTLAAPAALAWLAAEALWIALASRGPGPRHLERAERPLGAE